jgi:hypothetical protein
MNRPDGFAVRNSCAISRNPNALPPKRLILSKTGRSPDASLRVCYNAHKFLKVNVYGRQAVGMAWPK